MDPGVTTISDPSVSPVSNIKMEDTPHSDLCEVSPMAVVSSDTDTILASVTATSDINSLVSLPSVSETVSSNNSYVPVCDKSVVLNSVNITSMEIDDELHKDPIIDAQLEDTGLVISQNPTTNENIGDTRQPQNVSLSLIEDSSQLKFVSVSVNSGMLF